MQIIKFAYSQILMKTLEIRENRKRLRGVQVNSLFVCLFGS